MQGRLHWLLRQADDPSALAEEHRALYEAVAAGDSALAGSLALAHVQKYRHVALTMLFDPGAGLLSSSS